MRGFFITFEGIDGAGKTTQQHLAAQALREQGYDVLESREPGGTQLAERCVALVLDPELPLTTATQTLLYLAARSEHVDKLLRPRWKQVRLLSVIASMIQRWFIRDWRRARLRRRLHSCAGWEPLLPVAWSLI